MSWMGVPAGNWAIGKRSQPGGTGNASIAETGIDDLDEDQQAVDPFPPSQRQFHGIVHQAGDAAVQQQWHIEDKDGTASGDAQTAVSQKRRASWRIPDGRSDVSDSTAAGGPRQREKRKREHNAASGFLAQRRDAEGAIVGRNRILPTSPLALQEEKRRRLLAIDDWTGAKARQPLTMHFARFSQDAPAWGWKEAWPLAESTAAENTTGSRSSCARRSDKTDSLPRPADHTIRPSGDVRTPAAIGQQQPRTRTSSSHTPPGLRGPVTGGTLPSHVRRPAAKAMAMSQADFARPFQQWPTVSPPPSPWTHQRRMPGSSSFVRSSTTATSTTLPPQRYATETSSPWTESSQTYERTGGPRNVKTDQWHDHISGLRRHGTPLQNARVGLSRHPLSDVATSPVMLQSSTSNKTKSDHSVLTFPDRPLPQEAEREFESVRSVVVSFTPPRAAWPNTERVVVDTHTPENNDQGTDSWPARQSGTNSARGRSGSWTQDAIQDQDRCGDKNGGCHRATGEQEQGDGASTKIRTRSTTASVESSAERVAKANKEKDTDKDEEIAGLCAVQRVNIRSLPSLAIDEDPIEDDEADNLPVAKPVLRAKTGYRNEQTKANGWDAGHVRPWGLGREHGDAFI